MTKLLVCIDGLSYADPLCSHAAWASKRLHADVDLLHVLPRHSDCQAPGVDHTGAIGLGARSSLMEELAKVDEQRGRLEQQKGSLILDHAKKLLTKPGVGTVNTMHRRGSFTETVKELESDADMLFIGKRGEYADSGSAFLGANLEKVARLIHKPLFVVSSLMRPMKSFLIAYDGKNSAKKAVDFTISSPLLSGMECHLFAVEVNEGDINIKEAEEKLSAAGFKVITQKVKSASPDNAIISYVKESGVDLLLAGAYGHSRIRTVFLGSTTADLIASCPTALLLFR